MTDTPLSLSVSEHTTLFIEVEESPFDDGDDDGLERMGPQPRQALEGELAGIASSITEIAECFEAKFNAVPEPEDGFSLDSTEIELGFQLKGGADLFLVKGEAQAHIKVRLKWSRG